MSDTGTCLLLEGEKVRAILLGAYRVHEGIVEELGPEAVREAQKLMDECSPPTRVLIRAASQKTIGLLYSAIFGTEMQSGAPVMPDTETYLLLDGQKVRRTLLMAYATHADELLKLGPQVAEQAAILACEHDPSTIAMGRAGAQAMLVVLYRAIFNADIKEADLDG